MESWRVRAATKRDNMHAGSGRIFPRANVY